MAGLIGFVLLGFAIVLVRLQAADARVRRLQSQLADVEERLARLQSRVDQPQPHHSEPTRKEPPVPVRPPVAAILAVPADVVPGDAHAIQAPGEPSPESPAPVAADDDTRSRLEDLIGGRWLLFAGIAAIVLGVSYFVKFAFDNGWISEPLRVAAGVASGFLLLAGGMRFRSRGLPLFGQALAGAGILVHYVSIYAALHFYELIPAAAAFALMVLVTTGAILLADRQRSQPLAALALVGGFSTPLLVGGDRDSQVVLFTYIGILVAGVTAIARRRAWPLLGPAAYTCTFVLVLMWFFASYEAQLWLRTELFLTAYAVLFGYLLWLSAKWSKACALPAQLATTVLATAPLVYHIASLVLLAQHPGAWLVYVVGITSGGLLVAHRMRVGGVRTLLLVVVGLPMVAWLEQLPYPRWYVPALITVVALYVMHLAAEWEAEGHEGDRIGQLVGMVNVQLNGLALPLALYLFLDDRYAALNTWMMGALALWNVALAIVVRERVAHGRVAFLALAATLGAVTVVLAFDGPAVAVGWVAEGVLVGWLAARERHRTLAFGSALLIALGSLQLIDLLGAPLPAGETPILNGRAFAAVLAIGLMAWLAWRLSGDRAPEVRNHVRTALIMAANLLALVLISADLRAFFAQRAVDASLAGEARAASEAGLAEQVALSVTWASYAVGLVFAGIRRRYAPARYLAIGLFAVVIVKVLAHDIAGLDRLYRMLSVLGVGALLVLASYLYQKRSQDLDSSSG